MTMELGTSGKISIITPFYNPGKFFTECIQSIIDQSYQNWELLLVNDHSTDQSKIVATNFATKDPRIRVFQNKDKGLIPALRMAYENASGDFITRMDADDIMTHLKLEVLLRELVRHGSGFVAVGGVKYISEETLGNGYLKYEHWLNGLTNQSINFEEIYKECSIPSPNFLISRDDFDSIGGFLSDTYPEDYDLAFRMYSSGLKVCGITQVTHLWRDHPFRSSRTQEHYRQNTFIPLKVHYFLTTDYLPQKKLVVWGAGTKGKQVAQELILREVSFEWVTENQKKVGHNIYGQIIQSSSDYDWSNCQVIVVVSSPEEVQTIEGYLSTQESLTWKSFF